MNIEQYVMISITIVWLFWLVVQIRNLINDEANSDEWAFFVMVSILFLIGLQGISQGLIWFYKILGEL